MYHGFVSLKDVLVAEPSKYVFQIMKKDEDPIDPDLGEHEVSRRFEKRRFSLCSCGGQSRIFIG